MFHSRMCGVLDEGLYDWRALLSKNRHACYRNRRSHPMSSLRFADDIARMALLKASWVNAASSLNNRLRIRTPISTYQGVLHATFARTYVQSFIILHNFPTVVRRGVDTSSRTVGWGKHEEQTNVAANVCTEMIFVDFVRSLSVYISRWFCPFCECLRNPR